MPAPLHIGPDAQYKTGKLTLGIADTGGLGTLNICDSGDGCFLCLNGVCESSWPGGGGPGSDTLWGENLPLHFIYPILGGEAMGNFRIWDSAYGSSAMSINGGVIIGVGDNGADGNLYVGKGNITANDGNLKIEGYGRFGDFRNNVDANWSLMAGSDWTSEIASGFYVQANVNAITAEVYHNPVIDWPNGNGAIIGRDDGIASNETGRVWGVMGMAGGYTSTPGSYLNTGVYGYGPDTDDGVGVSGNGGKVGVHGYSSNVGVIGGGGTGGEFAGYSTGAVAYSLYGGTGIRATASDIMEPITPNIGTGADINGGNMGITVVGGITGGHIEGPSNTEANFAMVKNRGELIGGGTDPVPELDSSGIGVMGIANRYPVVGFQGGSSRTYGALGSNNSAYGGLMGAFGRGDNYGVYGYSPINIGVSGIGALKGIFACGGDKTFCDTKLGAQSGYNYGLFATINGATDAIKGECDNCSSAISAIHNGIGGSKTGLYAYSNGGSAIIGESTGDNWGGYFKGPVYIDGHIRDDNITLKLGSAAGGDDIVGYPNIWMQATGPAGSSVRVQDTLIVRDDLGVDGKHAMLVTFAAGDSVVCPADYEPKAGSSFRYVSDVTFTPPGTLTVTKRDALLCILKTNIAPGDWILP